jgi:hypothetical protein
MPPSLSLASLARRARGAGPAGLPESVGRATAPLVVLDPGPQPAQCACVRARARARVHVCVHVCVCVCARACARVLAFRGREQDRIRVCVRGNQ